MTDSERMNKMRDSEKRLNDKLRDLDAITKNKTREQYKNEKNIQMKIIN